MGWQIDGDAVIDIIVAVMFVEPAPVNIDDHSSI